MRGKDLTVKALCDWTRLLKINHNNEDIDEISNRVYKTNGRTEKLGIEVQGEILGVSQTIDAINVADNEVLLYELMINKSKDHKVPFALTLINKQTSKNLSNNEKFQ